MLRCLRLSEQFSKQFPWQNCRLLTTNESAAALRPFLFAVHPDLFGKYPRERHINEESLKKLNEYIDSLHQRKKPAPVTVLFYLRSIEENSAFRTVQISLLGETPRDVVKAVLRSCNLSLDYVDAIKSKTSRATDRPIRWSASFRAAYGMPDPDQPAWKPKPLNTLSSWMEKNVSKARTKQAEHDPILADAVRLKASLLEKYGLADVRWQSSWGLVQFRASLRKFNNLINNHRDDLDLKGRVVVFGSERGVCCQGYVVLPVDDVSENWLKVLRSIKKHDQILHKLPSAERYLSTLLNDIQVLRRIHPPMILAEEYLLQLHSLTMSLRAFLADKPGALKHENLQDIQLVLECASGPLMLSPSGKVLVPISCPSFLLIDFLNAEAPTARRAQIEDMRNSSQLDDTVENCRQKLGLRHLAKDENITPSQMISCCERLTRDCVHLSSSLNDLSLKVAMFYSVMSDGEIYIPWNYVLEDEY